MRFFRVDDHDDSVTAIVVMRKMLFLLTYSLIVTTMTTYLGNRGDI